MTGARGTRRTYAGAVIWLNTVRNVTFTNHHREGPLISSVFILQRLNVTDRDPDFLAGHDVGNGLREDVWPFLIEQTRNFTHLLRTVVSGLGLFTAHDLSFNRALADDHRHVVNGRCLRQRKGVDRFNLVGKWIGELLCN